jgi:hypothetical protein
LQEKKKTIPSTMEENPSPLPSESLAVPTYRKKSLYWKESEDEQLVKSWLDISQDPVIGNEQTSSVFWERVHQSYEVLD